MSESSPIKDALYAKIDLIGQNHIHELLSNGKFIEIFEKIYEPVINSMENIDEYEPALDEIEAFEKLDDPYFHTDDQ